MDSSPVPIMRSSSIYPEDVSPPDSPITTDREYGHSRKSSYNVSPISTENPSPFATRSPSVLKHGRYNSNLPVPKKNMKKFWKLPDKGSNIADQDANTVRWDEYSGEPTTSDRGKPPSTTPGAVRLHEDPAPGQLNVHNFGNSTYISSGNAIPRKRVGNRDISDTSITLRPEWKGAGGRHAIIRPPADKPLPSGQSAKFPPGLHKKQQMEEEEASRRLQEQLERERLERAEMERVEQERRVEEERIEEVRREQQRQEEERLEAQRREQERAEQARLDKERAEQDRRIREKVAQARRERDLAIQAQKEKAAQKAEMEKKEAEQRLRKERGPDWAFYPPDTQRRPSPTAEEMNAQPTNGTNVSGVRKPVSQEPTSTPASSTHTALYNPSWVPSEVPSDRRSPLARNPSDEETQDGRKQSPPLAQQDHDQDQPANASTPDWQPRGSSLSPASQHKQDSVLNENRFRTEMQNVSTSNEPKSRFSTTTYATTAFNDSPPATPEFKSESPTLSNTPDSILNRKRPIAQAGISNARATARKPIPSEVPKSLPDPDMLNSKSLPKAPPNVPKVPTVQTLQAKQDALRRRRRNIETVIHELTEVVQPSSVAYDMASRQEIKRTVEQLRKELAEVNHDEHETGLKLHRAWKRQDDFAIFEPTSIWVRRVTT